MGPTNQHGDCDLNAESQVTDQAQEPVENLRHTQVYRSMQYTAMPQGKGGIFKMHHVQILLSE